MPPDKKQPEGEPSEEDEHGAGLAKTLKELEVDDADEDKTDEG